jgi:hypothetical protein
MKNTAIYMVLRGRRVVEWVGRRGGGSQSTCRTPVRYSCRVNFSHLQNEDRTCQCRFETSHKVGDWHVLCNIIYKLQRFKQCRGNYLDLDENNKSTSCLPSTALLVVLVDFFSSSEHLL